MRQYLLLFVIVLWPVFLLAQAIAIDNENCEEQRDRVVVVGEIQLEGNDVTRDKIVLREMEFQSGDTLLFSKLCAMAKLCKENLLNRSLFNFVYIDLLETENSMIVKVKIRMIERWYVWPLPIFELADRNFNAWLESRDFSRVNYGVFITHNNFRGRMETLKLLLRAGYNQDYSLLYEIPYLTKEQNIGVGIQVGFSRSREISYQTSDNKQLYYKNEEAYTREAFYLKLMASYRIGYRFLHQVYLGYENFKFLDTIAQLNPQFMGMQTGNESKFFTLLYLYKQDFRDSKPYPLDGHYFDFEFSKYGFGLLEKAPDFYYLKATFDWYAPLSKRWFWATNITGKFSGGEQQPYYLQRGLGFQNDFVRSYELYVIDGADFGLFKNNLKFNLIKPKTRTIPLIPSEKFSKIHYALYVNLFLDMGYAHQKYHDRTNPLTNDLLIGTGIGLDLVTYYDLVFRLEYSRNKMKEYGFFIHFTAPI
ncbi:MAG: POTRA domain-containing protein [Bacteroidales bacterium]|jgi:outer membrane protein assembly factor BamA|nr:POTRA domain-containing protein [Bacteroidales bacterium]